MGRSKKTARPVEEYKIELTQTALQMLADIKDKRTLESIVSTIERLKIDPEKIGKPLIRDLSGFRSIRAAGQRYRVIYTVEEKKVIVIVVVIGMRKEGDRNDIYNLAKKLINLGLVGAQKINEK